MSTETEFDAPDCGRSPPASAMVRRPEWGDVALAVRAVPMAEPQDGRSSRMDRMLPAGSVNHAIAGPTSPRWTPCSLISPMPG